MCVVLNVRFFYYYYFKLKNLFLWPAFSMLSALYVCMRAVRLIPRRVAVNNLLHK